VTQTQPHILIDRRISETKHGVELGYFEAFQQLQHLIIEFERRDHPGSVQRQSMRVWQHRWNCLEGFKGSVWIMALPCDHGL